MADHTDHILFYAWGVYISRIISPTKAEVWLAKPTVDPATAEFPPPHTTLALDVTPVSKLDDETFDWAAVLVDDHNDDDMRGATRMGGQLPWPETVDSVYLSKKKHDDLMGVADRPYGWPQKFDTPTPADPKIMEHQLQAVLHIDRTGETVTSRRYIGFHARMLSNDGDRGRFQVCEADVGDDISKGKIVTLLFADLDWRERTVFSTVVGLDEIGALFVRWKAADRAQPEGEMDPKNMILRSPKLPLGLGDQGGRFTYRYDPEYPDGQP